MAKYPSLPLFTDAFIADTMHLNAEQTGAYLMLLMCAWRTKDGSIPNDDALLSRFTRMDVRTWKKNKDVVLEFWQLNDETQKFTQARLLDERNYVDQLARKNSKAGKVSALKRKERDATNVQPKANKNPTPIPTPTPTPTPTKDSKKRKISLNELSVEHIAPWLGTKRIAGVYTMIDEHRLLEMFKDYCTSKNRTYEDYVAGLRNAFEWKNVPTKGIGNGENRHGQQRAGKSDQAKQAIMRGIS